MILLDTHTLIWLLEDSPRMGPRTRDLISSSAPRFASAISHAEITIKSMRGKLKPIANLWDLLPDFGLEPLPLLDRHVSGLPAFETLVRRDPFDRLLLAQAHVDGLTLITADEVLLECERTFDATR